MKKLSNRHLINLNKIKNPVYNIGDALNLLKETSTAKFLETVELHVNLNINPKYPDQQLRATVILPHGTGKKIKIAALVAESEIKNAKEAGAELVDSDQLLNNIGKGLINFDVLIATPEMMPKLAKLGRILGPKGLMPSPKSGTVTDNIKKTIEDFKKKQEELLGETLKKIDIDRVGFVVNQHQKRYRHLKPLHCHHYIFAMPTEFRHLFLMVLAHERIEFGVIYNGYRSGKK